MPGRPAGLRHGIGVGWNSWRRESWANRGPKKVNTGTTSRNSSSASASLGAAGATSSARLG